MQTASFITDPPDMCGTLKFALFALCLVLGGATQTAACVVADPTGTPLAIRDAPRGTKIGSLVNGDQVRIEQIANDDRGLPWARISGAAARWVFRNYLNCESGSGAGFDQSEVFSLECKFRRSVKRNGNYIIVKNETGILTIDPKRKLFKWRGKDIGKIYSLSDSNVRLHFEFSKTDSRIGYDEEINRETGEYSLGHSWGEFDEISVGNCQRTQLVPFDTRKF